MEISLLKVLLNDISCFFQLLHSDSIKFEPVLRYYLKIEGILKLLKSVLDAIVDAEIASNEPLQKAFAGMDQSVDEIRELFESCQPLMSKLYFVCSGSIFRVFFNALCL